VGLAPGGAAVMRSIESVITTTNNKMVVSANSAVSIGRWSDHAIIASFLTLAFVLSMYREP
jgi:hypothetical protein